MCVCYTRCCPAQNVQSRAANGLGPLTHIIHISVDSKKLVARISLWDCRDYRAQVQILPRFSLNTQLLLVGELCFRATIRWCFPLVKEKHGCLGSPFDPPHSGHSYYPQIHLIIWISIIISSKPLQPPFVSVLNHLWFALLTNVSYVSDSLPRSSFPQRGPAGKACSAHLVRVPHISYLVGITSILL